MLMLKSASGLSYWILRSLVLLRQSPMRFLGPLLSSSQPLVLAKSDVPCVSSASTVRKQYCSLSSYPPTPKKSVVCTGALANVLEMKGAVRGRHLQAFKWQLVLSHTQDVVECIKSSRGCTSMFCENLARTGRLCLEW